MRIHTGLALATALLLLPAAAPSAGVVAVLSNGSPNCQEGLEGLKAALGDVPSATLPALPDLSGAKVVVTFGSEAALAHYPSSAALVAVMLGDPSLEIPHEGEVTRVGFPPAAAVLLAKIRALDPKARSLAVLDPAGHYKEYFSTLRAAAGPAGLTLKIVKVAGLADLAGVLPGLKGSSDALWLPPDILFMNPKVFGAIKDFCKAASIAFFAPDVRLARAGALAGVDASSRQIGQAAGAAAKAYGAGGKPGAWGEPEKAESTINKGAAAALGLSGSVDKADDSVE